MNPTPASGTLGAFPTGGEPYLINNPSSSGPRGSPDGPRHQAPALPLIRGKVTEQGSSIGR